MGSVVERDILDLLLGKDEPSETETFTDLDSSFSSGSGAECDEKDDTYSQCLPAGPKAQLYQQCGGMS
jgi:hypothetical protein